MCVTLCYGCTETGIDWPIMQSCRDVSFHGDSYDLVEIGNQCWFAENLRTTRFANGDSIPRLVATSDWVNNSNPATVQQYLAPLPGDMKRLPAEYGSVYNWYAVKDSRNVCPDGFHAATNYDWNELIDSLGGQLAAGIKLRRSEDWGMGDREENSNTENQWNASGFSALPITAKGKVDSSAYSMTSNGHYWSMTSSLNGKAWAQRLNSRLPSIERTEEDKYMGFAVRCVRDSEDGCNPVTYHNYTYDVTKIGDACWFAENLRAKKYRDGRRIGTARTLEGWYSNLYDNPKWVAYENDEQAYSQYGLLYQYTEKNICPSGWHQSKDDDWINLEGELGIHEEDALTWGDRGTELLDSGDSLKSIYGWSGVHTDPLAFNALPAGFRVTVLKKRRKGYDQVDLEGIENGRRSGDFFGIGSHAIWWRGLHSDPIFSRIKSPMGTGVRRNTIHRSHAFSFRCVLDKNE